MRRWSRRSFSLANTATALAHDHIVQNSFYNLSVIRSRVMLPLTSKYGRPGNAKLRSCFLTLILTSLALAAHSTLRSHTVADSLTLPPDQSQTENQNTSSATSQRPMLLSLDTSPLFGLPGVADVNQAGDYAFLGNGGTAIFVRPSGGSIRRSLQTGDPVPGVPNSRTDLIGSPRLNSTGKLAFIPQLITSNGLSQAAILVDDGGNLQKIITAAEIAPGTGGLIYGRNIALGGFNNSGDIAFTAPLTPLGSLAAVPAQTTLFISPNGGPAVRIAGPGDVAPGTGGTLTGIALAQGSYSLNNAGEVIFRAQIVGGSGGFGLFVGSTGGVRKVVANGDPIPGGGTFSFPTSAPSSFFNNAGQVAFTNGTFFIHSVGTGIVKAVATGDGAPVAIGGTLTLTSFANFSDGGVIVFTANVTGGSTSGGLFRFVPGTGVETVAVVNQAAPGAGSATFSAFAAISINQTGRVSFRGTLTGGAIQRGIYQQSASGNPANVALEGQPTTAPGGGSILLVNATFSKTLDDGRTYFGTDIFNGQADYAEYLGSPALVAPLMNTGENLPAGSRLTLRNFSTQTAGDFLAYNAQQAGGKYSVIQQNSVTNALTTVGMAGDIAPGTGGAKFRASGGFYVNSVGSVVFNGLTIGGTQFLASGVFVWTPVGGVAKLVHFGDIDPNSGAPFTSASIGSLGPSPINDSNQVAFRGTVLNKVGIYVGTAGGAIQRIVQNGDPAPGGGTFNTFSSTLGLNQSGQVAFQATTTGGPGQNSGLFVHTPGGGLAKLAVSGDAAPGGGTFFSFPTTFRFNDSGEVAFIATLNGATAGAFVGAGGSPTQLLARDGTASPAGGTFVMTSSSADILINNQHDVVFRSTLTGG